MSLHDELQRLAERAPVADVPHDTWARARRAQRRERVAALVAAAAVVAVVAGLVTWLPSRPDAPVGDSSSLGVPDHLYAVPERMGDRVNDDSWLRDEVSDDPSVVGVGAAAWVTDQGLPVVVDARRGGYHLLDLPGFTGNNLLTATGPHPPALALSPDGRFLAYAWAGPAPRSDAVPMPSGIRVVDLDSGDVRTIRLRGGRGVVVDSIDWSPGSAWLVWRGRVSTYWTATSSSYRGSTTGRVAPGATTSEEVPDGRGEPVVGIADDGTVTLLEGRRATSWNGRAAGQHRLTGPDPVGAAATGPSGRRVVFGTTADTDAIASLDTATDRLSLHRYLADLYPDGAASRPLGWLDDRLLVALVTPAAGADAPAPEPQLVVTTPRRGPTSTYRIVGHTDPTVPDSLSVAVDLMTLGRPTVDRPEPDWPWSDERRALTIGLGTAAALAALLVARTLRRRRPGRHTVGAL